MLKVPLFHIIKRPFLKQKLAALQCTVSTWNKINLLAHSLGFVVELINVVMMPNILVNSYLGLDLDLELGTMIEQLLNM